MINPIFTNNALLLAVILALPNAVAAQETVSDTDSAAVAPPAPAAPDDETDKKLDELTEALAKQQSQLSAQQEQFDALKLEMQTRLDEAQQKQEDLEIQIANNQVDDGKLLSVYGFMDTSFILTFPEFEDSVMRTVIPDHSTFMMGNVNLFVKSELSPSLEVLLETRFTFQPNGEIVDRPLVLYVHDGGEVSSGEFVRVSTDVSDGRGGTLRYGAVVIERAQFDWKPVDWFKFRMGRYLTPYGIYNEDHGSPVQIDTAQPAIISNEYLPTAQTGIMIFGSGYPTDFIGMEYAVTLSNGRGPVSELFDLDENKAIGLRGKLKFEGKDLKITAGGYGYYGKYTENIYTIKIYTTADRNAFDPSVDQPIRADESSVEKYKEYILSADLKFEYKGVQLMGEYVVQKVDYLTPPKLKEELALNQGVGVFSDAVASNYIAQGAYVLLAWTLPLEKLLKQTLITPFFGLDYMSPHDLYSINQNRMLRFGLNIKPGPYVTLKSAARVIEFEDETFFGGPSWSWTNQVAVSF